MVFNEKNHNVNHLKLTPQKLAEWGKRLQNTPITQLPFMQNQSTDLQDTSSLPTPPVIQEQTLKVQFRSIEHDNITDTSGNFQGYQSRENLTAIQQAPVNNNHFIEKGYHSY